MTIQEANQQLLSRLELIYDQREATAITDLVMEGISGWKKIDRIINKERVLSEAKEELLSTYTNELLAHRPVQYVLHEAWFCGMKLYVDERVLIPRPETEELVEWMIAEIAPKEQISRITARKTPSEATVPRALDVGTGSGCIALALKKKLPTMHIFACDVSRDALQVAKENAALHHADINFFHQDFLDGKVIDLAGSFDYIVSNPPYIPIAGKKSMDCHVLNYEPHIALFVPDEKPLAFYEAIADFALAKLNASGKIWVELHEDFASDVKKLFLSKGFASVEIRQDMHGRDRMLKATLLL